jgi:hypothetical protein
MQILKWLNAGWRITQRHPWMISMLFIYQFIWGFVLFKFMQSIVIPLLHRFPGEFSHTAVQVFLAEGQFQLFKTNAAYFSLWILLAILLLRMIITPLLNAGIYYSIHRDESKQIRPFLKGIRTLGLSFVFIYFLQILIWLLPMYWLIPYIKNLVASHPDYMSILWSALPLLIGFWIYTTFLKICFMYVQFGKASGASLLHSQLTFFRNLLPIVSLSCILLIISGLVALLSISISMIWAGFFAVMLHQLYYLAKTFIKIWDIGTQYQIWNSKQEF